MICKRCQLNLDLTRTEHVPDGNPDGCDIARRFLLSNDEGTCNSSKPVARRDGGLNNRQLAS